MGSRITPSEMDRLFGPTCGACQGRGYWTALRGPHYGRRVRCEQCDGNGRISPNRPKNIPTVFRTMAEVDAAFFPNRAARPKYGPLVILPRSGV